MKKVVAVIEEPKSCDGCMFYVLVWQHPFWSREKPNTKGFYCKLDIEGRVIGLHIDDMEFKAGWCPLKPLN